METIKIHVISTDNCNQMTVVKKASEKRIAHLPCIVVDNLVVWFDNLLVDRLEVGSDDSDASQLAALCCVDLQQRISVDIRCSRVADTSGYGGPLHRVLTLHQL